MLWNWQRSDWPVFGYDTALLRVAEERFLTSAGVIVGSMHHLDGDAQHIPGGAATVTHSWPSAERLALTVATMGVEVPCTVDAEDNRLRVTLHLPGMLSLMSGPIAAIVEKQGERLMLDNKTDRTI